MENNSFEIFKPGVEHAEILSELGSTTFGETFVGLMYYTQKIVDGYTKDAFALSKMKADLQDPKATFFLMRSKGEYVGYAKLIEKDPPACIKSKNSIYLDRIYLRRSVLGKGFGRVLLNAVFEKAREQKYQTLWLSVWEYNRRAVEFYLKVGFKKSGDWEWAFESEGVRYVDIDWLFSIELSETNA